MKDGLIESEAYESEREFMRKQSSTAYLEAQAMDPSVILAIQVKMAHMRQQIAYLDDQLIKAKSVIRLYQENPQSPLQGGGPSSQDRKDTYFGGHTPGH